MTIITSSRMDKIERYIRYLIYMIMGVNINWNETRSLKAQHVEHVFIY